MEEEQNVVPIPKGKCNLCSGTFSKAAMTNHLKACREKNPPKSSGRAKPRQEKVFHLVVEGHGLPHYWMHVEAPASAPLSLLDNFLRRTWLECCGHMSAFTIGKTRYSGCPMAEFDESGINVALDKVLRPRMKFYHEYDFGTTTALALKVVSLTEGLIAKKSVRILARNEPPEIPCDVCGKLATKVCCVCIWEADAWFCDGCAPKHECGEDMLQPVVNSPRTGMCAYTGELDWPPGQ